MAPITNDVNDYVVSSFINDNDSDDDFDAQTKSYYCNCCNTQLFYNGRESNAGKHEFICTKCNITFYPQNEIVKKRNKFETPGEQEPLTATVDNTPTTSVTSYLAQQKLPPSFEMLRKQGFNFTHYEEC